MYRLFLAAAIGSLSGAALAEPQTVILDLPTMNCAVCPITVKKKALDKVESVSKAEVNFENKRAQVTFDDAGTDTEALIEATTNAGYPSTIAGRETP